MHGNRQEENGVAVVSPRAGAEVLLHGLHDGEQLVCEINHVMEQHLQAQWRHVSTTKSHIYGKI